MKSIDTKELKAKLRSYLDKVSRGEKVIITDCGKEVALMVPISKERYFICSLMDGEKAKWNGGKPGRHKRYPHKGQTPFGEYP